MVWTGQVRVPCLLAFTCIWYMHVHVHNHICQLIRGHWWSVRLVKSVSWWWSITIILETYICRHPPLSLSLVNVLSIQISANTYSTLQHVNWLSPVNSTYTGHALLTVTADVLILVTSDFILEKKLCHATITWLCYLWHGFVRGGSRIFRMVGL